MRNRSHTQELKILETWICPGCESKNIYSWCVYCHATKGVMYHAPSKGYLKKYRGKGKKNLTH